MWSSNSVRQLAVGVLHQAVVDLHSDRPRVRHQAFAFFECGDFKAWAWLAGLSPAVVERMLPRPDAPRCPARAAVNGTALASSARAIASRTRSSEADDTVSPTPEGGRARWVLRADALLAGKTPQTLTGSQGN